MKRLISLMAAGAVMLSLAACGGAAEPQATDETPPAAAAQDQIDRDAAANAEDDAAKDDAQDVTLDEDLSAAAATYMNEAFGDAYGNPTPWYPDIQDIFIYSAPNDKYTASIFVADGCEKPDTIGNSLMMNFSDVQIAYVTVISESGELLFDRNNPLAE